MKKGFIFGVAITLVVVFSVGGAYYLGTQRGKPQEEIITSKPQPETTPTPQLQPPMQNEETDVPPEWLTYKNDEYGFEISFPENYKALDDEENLYGWPDALVLIYGGGQSYDLAIEVWNNVLEYESKYSNAENLTVKQVGSKYITLLNTNFDEEVNTIIETFKITE